MTQILFEGVSRQYHPGHTAVDSLSFEVRKGEVYTILGPSGCGKTTTLRLAAGFEKPDRGRISISGRVVAAPDCWVPPEKRGVGMVFQNYALFPHLDVMNNVSFGLKGLPAGSKAGRAGDFIELVGLTGYEKRFPHELSGGQQQRVALARALCPGPEVILLDEPFSNLDTDLKDQMRGELKNIIRATGCTAVLVTHDQKDALAISSRIMVMRSGSVQQVGDPRSVYLSPANEFVAAFIGRSNLITGRVKPGSKFLITEVGEISCNPDQLKGRGVVRLSVRPEGFRLAGDGNISGRVKSVNYLGSDLECLVEVPGSDGKLKDLLIRIDPRKSISAGDAVSLLVLPEYVAVV